MEDNKDWGMVTSTKKASLGIYDETGHKITMGVVHESVVNNRFTQGYTITSHEVGEQTASNGEGVEDNKIELRNKLTEEGCVPVNTGVVLLQSRNLPHTGIEVT